MTKASRPNPGNSSLILHTETRVMYSNGIVFRYKNVSSKDTLKWNETFASYQSPWNIVKTISCAKEIIYWPEINNEITNYYTTQHTRHPMDESSNGYFSPWRKTVIIAWVNYTPSFLDISQLPDKLFSMVVIHAKHLFSKYGISKVVISDNGPKFTANTFKTFSKQCYLNIPPQVHTLSQKKWTNQKDNSNN